MNILHVVSNLDPASGGVAAAATGLAMAQQGAGMNPSLMSTFPHGRSAEAADVLRRAGLPIVTVGPCPGRINRHPLIRPTLEQALNGIDIVHIHGLWEQVQHDAAVLARRRRIPYIISAHGMLDAYSLGRSPWIKRFFLALRVRRNLNLSAAIHYTAEAERELAQRLGLTPATLVEPNGLDLHEFRELPPRGIFRKRFSLDPDRPLILFLSRLHPKKGLDLLIPAFAQYLADNAAPGSAPPPLLVIAGPDTHGYRGEVEAMVTQHRVTEHVVFTGMLHGPERISAYVDSDLFVLPSYQENFGIVVAEAMAAGVAVVITDKVNIDRDVIASGGGAVVPTRIEPLAEELRKWMPDAERRRIAGQNGRAFAFDKYGWQAIAQRWQGHLDMIIDRARAADGAL